MLALVLVRRDIREYDQIVSLYTLERGKIDVLARGVKKNTSKNSAYIEPGCFVEAEIIPGKEVMHLGSVVPTGIIQARSKADDNIAVLGWSLNFVNHYLHHHYSDPNLFNFLVEWVRFVKGTTLTIPVLWADIFAVKLFKILGFDFLSDQTLSTEDRGLLKAVLAKEPGLKDVIKSKQLLSRLHQLVLAGVYRHGEKAVPDWAKLALFNEKC